MENYLEVVGFDLARKLREIGFDWECNKYYSISDKFRTGHKLSGSIYKVSNKHKAISAPTIDLASKWFREVHGYNIWVVPEYYRNGINWNVQVTWYLPKEEWTGHNIYNGTMMYGDNGEFKTFEEALSFGVELAIVRYTKSDEKEFRRKFYKF